MSSSLFVWSVPLLGVVALALTTFNALFWPRGRKDGARSVLGRVSVCIPARNEALSIRACVEAALALDPFEVVVVDDGSSDATPAILRELAARDERLRVVRVDEPLPAGWVGKPRACARLVEHARGDSLLFLDADVVADTSLIARLGSFVVDHGADVVTAVPRQVTGSFVERLVLPLLHVTYTSWLPLPLVWRARDPRFLAANGQILWMPRAVLDEVGGFAAVRGEIVDDMALCRAFKRAGRRVVFADGDGMGRCRMYRSARAVVDGFSKNLFEGTGGAAGVIGVFALYGSAFLLPWVALLASPWVANLWWPAVTGVAVGWTLRLLHVVRHGSTVGSALLHPVGVIVLLAIAARSWLWARRGTIHWAGRIYPSRALRVEMPQ
jgi:glycosyltransferase involved in cell wall biosynthesis